MAQTLGIEVSTGTGTSLSTAVLVGRQRCLNGRTRGTDPKRDQKSPDFNLRVLKFPSSSKGFSSSGVKPVKPGTTWWCGTSVTEIHQTFRLSAVEAVRASDPRHQGPLGSHGNGPPHSGELPQCDGPTSFFRCGGTSIDEFWINREMLSGSLRMGQSPHQPIDRPARKQRWIDP